MLHYAGLYFANNDVATVMGGDRELLSFDGGGGAYNGSVSATSADGRTLTLSGDPVYAGYIPPGPRLWNYTSAAIVVLSGMGAGTRTRFTHVVVLIVEPRHHEMLLQAKCDASSQTIGLRR